MTGLLVAEGDVAGMGAALARLLADPALAAGMGAAGHARFLAGFTQDGHPRPAARDPRAARRSRMRRRPRRLHLPRF